MYDIINVWMSGEDLIKSEFIGDVDVVEGRAFAGDQLDAIQAFIGGVVQVVNNDNLIVRLEEGKDGE